MKRTLSVIATVILCMNLFLCTAFSVESSTKRIDYDDGSYAIISISPSGLSRATSADSKTYTYYNSNDVKCFSYTLYANFTYDGSTSSADSCYGRASIYLQGWDGISHNEFTSGNTAYGSAIFSGPDGKQQNASLYLRCDKNGNVT